MKRTITATRSTSGESARISVPDGHLHEYRREIGTGIYYTGHYVGRYLVVMGTESIWDRGDGRCRGQSYMYWDLRHARDRADILHSYICDEADVLRALDRVEDPAEA